VRVSCLSLLLLLCCSPAFYAQTETAGDKTPAPLLKTRTNAVAVDVVVTERGDQPVLALHKQDFAVIEDGKAQAIDFFEEHTASDAPAAVPAALPAHVYSNQPAAPHTDSVNVLLLDSLNTEEADQARVRKQMESFLQTLNPGARVAIFRLDTRLRLVQGFTGDRSLLEAALGGKATAPGTTSASRSRDDDVGDKEELSILAEKGDPQALQSAARSMAALAGDQAGRRASLTLAALEQLARSLTAIPGRKNVIWCASSFPVALFPDGVNRQTLSNGREIPDAVRETVNLLTQAKVALYPISAQGIFNDPTMNPDSGGLSIGDDSGKTPQQQDAVRGANVAAMEQLAYDTGGQASHTTNDLSKAMTRAVQNGAHYYTLVYTPTNEKMDGKFRHIEIKLNQGKVQLDYRRGYYADTQSTPAPTTASDPLTPLLARGLPSSTQIVYRVRVLPADPQPAPDAARAGGNSKLKGPLTRYGVDFSIPTVRLNLEDAANNMHNGKVEVALVAYGRDGAALNWTGGAMTVSLNETSYAAAQKFGVPAHLEIDLPETDMVLATGVYAPGSRSAGTLEIPLSVAAVTPTGASR
jgi:VWFA-related protein